MVSDNKSGRPPSSSDVLVFDAERLSARGRSTVLWDSYAAEAKTLSLSRETVGKKSSHVGKLYSVVRLKLYQASECVSDESSSLIS